MHPATTPLPDIPPCLFQAAADYAIPARALLGILRTEGGRSGTLSQNANGTTDHGPFQINTVWARKLEASFGISPFTLTHDFCWSARAAAYIVRYEINLANGNFWEGVGHYHSRTARHKEHYVQKVYSNSLKY